MNVRTDAAPLAEIAADWLIVGCPPGDGPAYPALEQLDSAMGGAIRRLRESGELGPKPLAMLPVFTPSGVRAARVLLVAIGKPDACDAVQTYRVAAAAALRVSEKQRGTVALALPWSRLAVGADSALAIATAGALVGSQGQDLYKNERKRYPFGELVLATGDLAVAASRPEGRAVGGEGDAISAARRGEVLGRAMNLARELVNRPPAEIYPESFAERCRAVAAERNLECRVFNEDDLRRERMEALLAVGAGSERPPRVVEMRYAGAENDSPLLALVGKGVTFDSGGLSLKSADNMETMKCDMAGAATVLAAMQAIAELKLPLRAIGLMGLVENLPSGSSMKVGDVLRARNGTTIEVKNTDAEGRLVLADVLSYAVDQKPAHIIDLATLTGACVVALGQLVTGLMTNNQEWAGRVQAAAQRAGEQVWPMPMFDDYMELIRSPVADIKNTGTGRWGGAITAAKFLENFVDDVPWVHLDIAGPAFADRDDAWREGGGTGVMVRTLVEVAREYGRT